MCDQILRSDILFRLLSEKSPRVKDILTCCQPNSIIEESLLVLVFTIYMLSWLALGLLTLLTVSERNKSKQRARRRSRILNDEDGFLADLSEQFQEGGGVPLTDDAIKGFNEMEETYEKCPKNYAELRAFRIAVGARNALTDIYAGAPTYSGEASSEDDHVQHLLNSIFTITRMEEEPVEMEENSLVNAEVVAETQRKKPWGSIKLKGRIRKLSELRKAAGQGEVEPTYMEMGDFHRLSEDELPYVSLNTIRKPDININTASNDEKVKKLSITSQSSGLSVSLINLNDEIYEELPIAKPNKGILRANTIYENRRHKRTRRHGVMFMEGQSLKAYSDIGTV